MTLNSRPDLIARLKRGKAAREAFVESHLAKTTASQIRAIRDRLGWSQEALASKVGMTQNAISRLESLHYGKATLTTLKRLAAAFDVALVVRFVPFSELVDWVSATPRLTNGLTTEAMAVPSFAMEEEHGTLQNARTTAGGTTSIMSTLGALAKHEVTTARVSSTAGSAGYLANMPPPVGERYAAIMPGRIPQGAMQANL